jgi:hypothetical protein
MLEQGYNFMQYVLVHVLYSTQSLPSRPNPRLRLRLRLRLTPVITDNLICRNKCIQVDPIPNETKRNETYPLRTISKNPSFVNLSFPPRPRILSFSLFFVFSSCNPTGSGIARPSSFAAFDAERIALNNLITGSQY